MRHTGGIDLQLWKEFQDGLTRLLDLPIGLYDGHGNVVVGPGQTPAVCRAASSTPAGGNLCDEHCKKIIAKAADKQMPHASRCRLNMQMFAVPLSTGDGTKFVISGGQLYVQESDFYEGVKGFELDAVEVDRLKSGIKILAAKEAASLPGIVRSLAEPFLKSLYMKGDVKTSSRAGKQLKMYRLAEKACAALAAVLDTNKLYGALLEKSADLVGARRSSLLLLDADENVLTVKASRGIASGVVGGISINFGEYIAGDVARRGTALLVQDIDKELPGKGSPSRYMTKSFISMPLKAAGRVRGVINVSEKTDGVFTREDLLALQAVVNYAGLAIERGEYHVMNEELKTLCMTDALTGLFNRRYFSERLFEEAERVRRHDGCFSVFMMDLDNFKEYNDKCGHVAGDELLKRASKAVKDAVRSMDVVARYGGEEFAVILPETAKTDAAVIADRIRIELSALSACADKCMPPPTISIGVAEFPADAPDADGLIDSADKALYRAKEAGKNRVVVYGV